jgi:hypothetical protein
MLACEKNSRSAKAEKRHASREERRLHLEKARGACGGPADSWEVCEWPLTCECLHFNRKKMQKKDGKFAVGIKFPDGRGRIGNDLLLTKTGGMV